MKADRKTYRHAGKSWKHKTHRYNKCFYWCVPVSCVVSSCYCKWNWHTAHTVRRETSISQESNGHYESKGLTDKNRQEGRLIGKHTQAHTLSLFSLLSRYVSVVELSLPVINISAISIIDRWISPLRNHSDISMLELKHQYFTDWLFVDRLKGWKDPPCFALLCFTLTLWCGDDKHTFLCLFHSTVLIIRSVQCTRCSVCPSIWFSPELYVVTHVSNYSDTHTQMQLSSSQAVKYCLFLKHTSAPGSLVKFNIFFLESSDLCDMVIIVLSVWSYSHASKLQFWETENCC